MGRLSPCAYRFGVRGEKANDTTRPMQRPFELGDGRLPIVNHRSPFTNHFSAFTMALPGQ
jgi:hypothetical protein